MIFNGQLVFSQDSISIGLNTAIVLASQNNTNIIISDDQVNSSKFAIKEAKAYFYIPTAPYSIVIGLGFAALVELLAIFLREKRPN